MSRPWEYWRDVEAQEEEHRVIPLDHLTQKQPRGEGRRCVCSDPAVGNVLTDGEAERGPRLLMLLMLRACLE